VISTAVIYKIDPETGKEPIIIEIRTGTKVPGSTIECMVMVLCTTIQANYISVIGLTIRDRAMECTSTPKVNDM